MSEAPIRARTEQQIQDLPRGDYAVGCTQLILYPKVAQIFVSLNGAYQLAEIPRKDFDAIVSWYTTEPGR